MAVEIPARFGWVALSLVFCALVHHVFMVVGVVKARKKYGVKYPALYAPESTAGANIFNCIQRAHQNSLETLGTHYVLTILAGLRFPVFATLASIVYTVGRIMYFNGYSTGIPQHRLKGRFMYLGFFGEVFAAIFAAISLLRTS